MKSGGWQKILIFSGIKFRDLAKNREMRNFSAAKISGNFQVCIIQCPFTKKRKLKNYFSLFRRNGNMFTFSWNLIRQETWSTIRSINDQSSLGIPNNKGDDETTGNVKPDARRNEKPKILNVFQADRLHYVQDYVERNLVNSMKSLVKYSSKCEILIICQNFRVGMENSENLLQYRKTAWLWPLVWLGPNLKATFKPQIYQFF